MKTSMARFVNEQILSRFNIRVVRVSSLEGGEATADRPGAVSAEPQPYPAALRQENVEGALPFATRFDLVKSLSPLSDRKVAEVGVAYGDFSRFLIDQLKPRAFHAYDLFRFHEERLIWSRPPAEILKGLTHKAFYEQRFEREIANGQVEVFEGDSAANLNEREDALYDIIYVDGDHSYSGVLRDATAAIKKLKPDGLLIFNDYVLYDNLAHIPYGIVYVVNDLCVNQGWKITHFAFERNMFCDVVIRRTPLRISGNREDVR